MFAPLVKALHTSPPLSVPLDFNAAGPACNPTTPPPSRVRSLEGLQVLDFAPGCVKTNPTALRFHQALKAGQPCSCEAEWQEWQRQHPCAPPLDPAKSSGPSGGGDAQAGWARGRDQLRQSAPGYGGGGGSGMATPGPGGRAGDICFRCKQPGGLVAGAVRAGGMYGQHGYRHRGATRQCTCDTYVVNGSRLCPAPSWCRCVAPPRIWHSPSPVLCPMHVQGIGAQHARSTAAAVAVAIPH